MEPRVRAMVRARLRDAHSERDVCIIDVSTRGLLATAALPPERGEFVEVQLGRHRLAGQVKWSGDHRFGVGLRDRVSVAAVIEGGQGTIALDRTAGFATRKQGLWQQLQTSPQMMGRAFQLGMFALAALVAALLISQLAGRGFAPMQQAALAMHDGRAD
ncbi:hypothetical protein GCM10009127_25470 [Alteraurantiacibacter aestuarii]